MTMAKGRERIAHIYQQKDNHQEAYIVANKNALLVIKDSIEKALQEGISKCVLMPKDGEVFELEIKVNDEGLDSEFWNCLRVPYCEYDGSAEFSAEQYSDFEVRSSKDLPEARKSFAGSLKRGEEIKNLILETINNNRKKENEKLLGVVLHRIEILSDEKAGYRLVETEVFVSGYNEESGFLQVVYGGIPESIYIIHINKFHIQSLDGTMGIVICDEENKERIKNEIPKAIRKLMDEKYNAIRTIKNRCDTLNELLHEQQQ